MGFLAFYGGVSPAVFSEEIRKRGMTYRQAVGLQRELIKLRKLEFDMRLKLAVISAGSRPR